jgi:hypothetical protein
MRRFVLPREVAHWSLTSIQLKLIKIGAKIVSHSRMTVFQMAQGGGPREAVPVDALSNPPPGEGIDEGASLEFVKDGDRKQGRLIMRNNYPRTPGKHEA